MNEELKSMNTLPIYIHIPFCKKKCDYCDFYSCSPFSFSSNEYFRALAKEFTLKKETIKSGNRKIQSLYFGGGTPSLIEPLHYKKFIALVKNEIRFIPQIEISMEVNPESVTLQSLKAYKKAGINRLSIGIQTLDNRILKYIGRLADKEKNLLAIKNAKKAGFTNISLDLMFGLPYQTKTIFLNDLQTLIQLAPTHFSLYSLIRHRGNSLAKKMKKDKPTFPDERELYDEAANLLKAKGYSCYEISNFARKRFQSIHNLAYWNYDEYEGLGPSAVSRMGLLRNSNKPDVENYLSQISKNKIPSKREKLNPSIMKQEYMMINLRKSEGIDLRNYKSLWGTDFTSEFKTQIINLKNKGLLEETQKKIHITEKGRFISNSIIIEFFN